MVKIGSVFIGVAYVKIETIQCDLLDQQSTQNMILTVKNKGYDVDHIIHAPANRFTSVGLKKIDWDNILTEMEIEVHSFLSVMQAFLPDMAKKKYGKVVVLLSSCTLGTPPETFTEYTTVKYALLGMVKSLASEYGGKGVQINGISPSMVETKLLNNVHQIFVEGNAKNSPLKRNLQPRDIAPAISYLMDDANDCVNGVNLNLSGGSEM